MATVTEVERRTQVAAVPRSFFEYVKSLGPGLVAVLTWLGAGDIVNSATAGGNYGYALMWAFVLCVLIRYLFVSVIAKYQLCNQQRNSVLGGLTQLHPWYAPFVLVCSLVLGHAVGVYLLTGASVACVKLSGFDNIRVWAVGLCLMAYFIAFRPIYRFLEKVFFVLAGILTVSFIGLAGWVGPSPAGIVKGVLRFALPATIGRFDAVTVMLAMVGAVAGGLGNLMYPYFAREKGWTGPAYRRVQQYDLILGILVLIVLNLSVWVVGAEVLHPRGVRVVDVDSLARLLGETLGTLGTNLFYVGIFAALFSNLVGTGSGFGYLASDAYLLWRPSKLAATGEEHRKRRIYRGVVSWVILTPLVWVLSGQTDFVGLTVVVNAAQVVIIPVLVIGLWIITANSKYIGAEHRNRWWENVSVGALFLLGCLSTYIAVVKVIEKIAGYSG